MARPFTLLTALVIAVGSAEGEFPPPEATACARTALAPDTLDAERTAVLGTIQRLFDAMRAKDTAAMRTLFDPGARLIGMRTRPDGSSTMQVLPWQRFAEMIANDRRGTWIERAWEPSVQIRGTLAQVWAMYDFHFDSTFSHCGVDAAQLLKTTDGWRIVSIADTYEPRDCPPRPAQRAHQ